ncbi:hypothetical protein BC628DRAFT_1014814 [Trametes gibbosa]|nr:hypothetical protein BC628DRAFT_1014814 [Trametes gibbosa]
MATSSREKESGAVVVVGVGVVCATGHAPCTRHLHLHLPMLLDRTSSSSGVGRRSGRAFGLCLRGSLSLGSPAQACGDSDSNSDSAPRRGSCTSVLSMVDFPRGARRVYENGRWEEKRGPTAPSRTEWVFAGRSSAASRLSSVDDRARVLGRVRVRMFGLAEAVHRLRWCSLLCPSLHRASCGRRCVCGWRVLSRSRSHILPSRVRAGGPKGVRGPPRPGPTANDADLLPLVFGGASTVHSGHVVGRSIDRSSSSSRCRGARASRLLSLTTSLVFIRLCPLSVLSFDPWLCTCTLRVRYDAYVTRPALWIPNRGPTATATQGPALGRTRHALPPPLKY